MMMALESKAAASPAFVGANLILKGFSNKGKSVVRRDGSAWVVKRVVDRVLFNPEAGPWLLVCCGREQASRWIHAHRDLNFIIELAANQTAVVEST
ncbi:hypothetical protein [Comamonas thiooxydans]|uniref:hypothetical protein n=1 Tax=Comamonas thiooxydans TaxID=363952 RepID=UPI000B412506|nr:hypothetical protein [Comamonas thiooxydans]